MPQRPVIAALLLAALALVGCTDGGEDRPEPETAATTATPSASVFSEALQAQQAGDLDTARMLFEEVVSAEPGNLLAHYNLGLVHQTQGDAASALRAYDEARTIDPNYVPALFNSATIYAQDDPARAIATYREIITLQPEAPTAYLNLGLLEIAQGQLNEGAANLEIALRQDPSLAERLDDEQRDAVEERVETTQPEPPS